MYGKVPCFAETSNTKRFKEGLRRLEMRGAPESTILLVSGKVGLGKTRTVRHHAVQRSLPYVRLKPEATVGWMLAEICDAMGLEPPHGRPARFEIICENLKKGLIADEIENGLERRGACIDMLRQIGEETELPIVLVGREKAAQAVARYPQIYSRVTAVVQYQSMLPEDYQAVADAYGIKLDRAAAVAMEKLAQGTMRLGMNAIKTLMDNAERTGNQHVTLKEMEALL